MIQEFQNIFSELSDVQWVILLLFMVVFVLRFLYLFLFTARVVFKSRKEPDTEPAGPISLIMTLRNEVENIRKNLPAILELKNLDIEVVAVDDYSQDNSLSVLGLLKQRYQRIKISSLSQETRYSVKLAQNIALKSASNKWVLITPITAEKATEEWITSFLQISEAENINLIIAYSSVVHQKGIMNLLYRVENFYQQLKSVAYISNNISFVYSEDNLAFRKEKYFGMGGYGKNIKEPYANFELLVNSFIQKKNTKINFTRDAAIHKQEQIVKTDYFDLLKKSIRIEKYLPVWKQLILAFDEFTKLLLLPLLFVNLVFVFPFWPLISMLTGIYLLAYVLIIKITLNRLNESKIFIPSLVYGLLMPYYKLFFKWHFSKTSQKKIWRNMY